MKKSLQYIVIFLAAIFLYSCSDGLSDYQKKSFIKFYGSYNTDVGQDVLQLPSGGYALTGTMIPDTVSKMFLLLTDEYGNQVENSPIYYGGDFETGGVSIAALDDGFILAGYIEYPSKQTDILLVRTDANGTEIWKKQYGTDGNEAVSHVIERKGGGFVVAGTTQENDQEDLWILMVDENGDFLSDMKGNSTTDDEANYILRTGDNYLVACTYNDAAFIEKDFMVLYIDGDCNLIDARSMGTDFVDNARSIVNYKGAYLLMGYSENTTTGNSQIALHTFSLDANLIKNPELLATISESDTDLEGEACAINSDGNIVVAGCRTKEGNQKILLQFIEEGGVVGEQVLFGDESGDQTACEIKKSLDGGLILIGTNDLGGNSVISLVKTDAGGTF